MSFCPLLSTAEKKVDCQKDCQWHLTLRDGTTECEINYISDQCEKLDLLDRIGGNVNYIANK